MNYEDPYTIQRILSRAKTIAIVGLSPNELRASHFVGYYLRRHGYNVIPVNPRETEILGQKSYPSVSAVPEPGMMTIALVGGALSLARRRRRA